MSSSLESSLAKGSRVGDRARLQNRRTNQFDTSLKGLEEAYMKYVVIDLEMCEVPKMYRTEKYKYSRETIQIGAVLLDDELNEADSFMTYVKPQYGLISPFIQKLTGISKKDVSTAPKMREALKNFIDWLPEDVTLVSWSDTDQMQLCKEIESKQIEFDGIEKLNDSWLDCQIKFSEIIKNPKAYKLVDAMNLSDIFYDDNIHDGLVDAKNTALLFKKMMTEKEYQFNKYYMGFADEEAGRIGA